MPHLVTLRGPSYTFECYGVHEAKQLGLIDSQDQEGAYAQVSSEFRQGEGKLLADWLETVPDAILVATGRYQIVVYRPRHKVVIEDVQPDDCDEVEREPQIKIKQSRVHQERSGVKDDKGLAMVRNAKIVGDAADLWLKKNRLK